MTTHMSCGGEKEKRGKEGKGRRDVRSRILIMGKKKAGGHVSFKDRLTSLKKKEEKVSYTI